MSSVNVEARSRSLTLCSEKNKSYYRCSDGTTHIINDKMYQIINLSGEESKKEYSLISSSVIGAQEENTVIEGVRVQVKGIDGVKGVYGAVASKGGKIILTDSSFKDVSTGFMVDSGTMEVHRGSVEAIQVGIHAESQATSVILADTKIKIEGQDPGQKSALFSVADAVIKMTGGSIDVTDAAALRVGVRGNITLDDVIITTKNQRTTEGKGIGEEGNFVAFNVSQNGSIYLKKTNATVTDTHGFGVGLETNVQPRVGQEEGIVLSRVNIEDSKIIVTGKKHGMQLKIEKGDVGNRQAMIFLKNTTFEVPQGTAIHSRRSHSYIGVTESTKISGDLLLTAENEASVAILSASSSLVGGAHVSRDSIAELYLTEGSQWVLTKRKEANSQSLNRLISSISFLKLSDSSVIFVPPTLQEYQTLYVGKGKQKVYDAQGHAHIYFNTHLNSDGSFYPQKTDRILIDGDVFGKTIVHVQLVMGNEKETIDKIKAQGISLIQVSGKAAEDSFQLSTPYIALEGLPYQYYLHAYGPSSLRGNAKISQRLIKGDGDFWDFRLESKYIQPIQNETTLDYSMIKVKDVVPQVPTYLLLPNALFQVGLVNISNQNQQSKILRNGSHRLSSVDNSPVLSMSGYGGSYHYVSDLSKFEYGYGGDLEYNALEAALFLEIIENVYHRMSFGVTGTYGKFFLQPQGVEKSQKSTFNQWSISAYGRIGYNTGFYLNGLLSYGLFKGDVFTYARGKTATLKGNPFNVSLSSGKVFVTEYKGLVVDPQIHLIYQNLQFYKSRDINGFDIDIGKIDQWVMRVGGHLTKTFEAFEKDRIISFYGKMHFVHCFGEKQVAYFKDTFQLGSFGSFLETGLGIHSQLSSKVILHGDLNYQHKFKKAGFSGIRFSGGVRYRF
ncbi:hypothetical protein ABID23_001035 [Bartonella silvatica]|uniref:Autotransporter domain-containing protein n=1 Tax=Bartonella silvatica TaxID=357760 RepID=A0ABV2HHN4_9HYPH